MLNILWHKNPEIQKFCEDLKLAINPITEEGNIYSQLMFAAMSKEELKRAETVQQVKDLYLSRLEVLLTTMKNKLEEG